MGLVGCLVPRRIHFFAGGISSSRNAIFFFDSKPYFSYLPKSSLSLTLRDCHITWGTCPHRGAMMVVVVMMGGFVYLSQGANPGDGD